MTPKLFIDGTWQAAARGGTIDVVDPATERVFRTCSAGTADDVDRAVTAAKRAGQGPWGRTTGRERAVVLCAIADAIEREKQALAELEVRDNGKPLAEALGDISDAAYCFNLYAAYAEELDARQGEAIAVPDDRFKTTVKYVPAGVAGLIVPWNYPLLMAAWKVAPALAAGCTLVLKPSEFTPLTALELARICEEAAVPPGVVNVVTGYGNDAGARLAAHPDVRKLAFTGSVPTGIAVATAAARDIKSVSLELGGKSPIVVFDDADLEQVVEWVMFGIFWNQGQVCSATSRLIVERGIAGRLIERLVEEARKITIGNGMDEGVLLGPLVSRSQYDKVLGYIEIGKQEARLASGGRRPPGFDAGYFLEPTIFTGVPPDARIWREEIFGPVLCVAEFGTEEEALTLANGSEFGLAAAVMTRDLERAARVADRFEAGVVWINCSQPNFLEPPWGGMKKSGVGRELGTWGLMNFLEPKQITNYLSPAPWGWYLKG
ncbi:aldehyde dehydrogenase family protein [Hyphomicrobium sp. DMF-1]|jgi:betaine-aldehyde dehydrogenase|uniref:aldehyde dehydrogenase family protein n=1 Tax=Hyphomicrobium sp. DMF-1 TaxID=3019544 RepID=UPI0022EBD6FF|nr:aldehyde dehydrogenase family protein [Hyphomicrobium sp. DMF-1]WBT39756.1 aldehyde dehydrogenase family protein [Hyphomicrobium sp. DMF-1]